MLYTWGIKTVEWKGKGVVEKVYTSENTASMILIRVLLYQRTNGGEGKSAFIPANQFGSSVPSQTSA